MVRLTVVPLIPPALSETIQVDWSAEIARLPMAVLLVFADNDSISQSHSAEFFALLGGGVQESGRHPRCRTLSGHFRPIPSSNPATDVLNTADDI